MFVLKQDNGTDSLSEENKEKDGFPNLFSPLVQPPPRSRRRGISEGRRHPIPEGRSSGGRRKKPWLLVLSSLCAKKETEDLARRGMINRGAKKECQLLQSLISDLDETCRLYSFSLFFSSSFLSISLLKGDANGNERQVGVPMGVRCGCADGESENYFELQGGRVAIARPRFAVGTPCTRRCACRERAMRWSQHGRAAGKWEPALARRVALRFDAYIPRSGPTHNWWTRDKTSNIYFKKKNLNNCFNSKFYPLSLPFLNFLKNFATLIYLLYFLTYLNMSL